MLTLGAVDSSVTPASASHAFAAAINGGDVAAALECWASDAVIVGPDGSEARGRNELEARFRDLVDAGVRLDITVADDVEASSTATARTRMTMTPPSGDPVTFRATVVYAKLDGRWRLAIDRVEANG